MAKQEQCCYECTLSRECDNRIGVGIPPCAKLAESAPSASTNIASDEIADYDCGIINDYGGGNVQWWQDYLRHEINRCNEYWRLATSHVA